MGSYLSKMIPLGLGAAVSPTMLAAALLILSSPKRPKTRTFAYLLGAAVTVIVIGIIAVMIGGKAQSTTAQKPSTVSAVIDLSLGMLLLFIAARGLISKPKQRKQTGVSTDQKRLGIMLAQDIGIGIVLTATNFTSLVFYLAAAKQTADSGLGIATQILGMSIVAVFFLLPVLLPLLITLVAPTIAKKILTAINRAMEDYGGYIMPLIAAIFGVYLAYKGLRVFF